MNDLLVTENCQGIDATRNVSLSNIEIHHNGEQFYSGHCYGSILVSGIKIEGYGNATLVNSNIHHNVGVHAAVEIHATSPYLENVMITLFHNY